MHNIYHCFWVRAPLATVHSALTKTEGIAGWWTKGIEGNAAPGSVTTFRFTSGAFNKMKIVSVAPDEIRWECVDGHEEWIGTQIMFELRPDGEQVKVCFTHSGFKKLTEYVGECSFHWAYYLQSLQAFCEKGQGMPNDG